jgi:hypothetical protein
MDCGFYKTFLILGARAAMSIRSVVGGLSVAAVLALSGCKSIGPDFNEMTAAYTGSMEVNMRNNILMNIMRAAYDMPMTFTDIPSVLGQGFAQGQAGLTGNIMSLDPTTLAGFFSGASGSNASLSAGLTVSRQFSFSLSSLDNQQFTKGFLTPVTLDNVHFFAQSSQLSKDLLFSLLVNSIEIHELGKAPQVFVNNPGSPDYPKYQEIFNTLLDYGLTTEAIVKPMDLGPVLTPEQAVRYMTSPVGNLPPGVILRKLNSPQGERFQASIVKPTTHMCMGNREKRNEIAARFGASIICSDTDSAGNIVGTHQSAASMKGSAPVQRVAINLRSTRDIFRYLGKVAAAQTAAIPPVVTTIRTNMGNNQYDYVPLLIVNKGSSIGSGSVISSVKYFGVDYTVPLEKNGYSSVVFDLMSLLVTLSKIPGSIPASPGILIQ